MATDVVAVIPYCGYMHVVLMLLFSTAMLL